jgi:hypothetical protein
VASVSAEPQNFFDHPEGFDPYLFLAEVKTRIANHYPLTYGDAEAWIICNRSQDMIETEHLARRAAELLGREGNRD